MKKLMYLTLILLLLSGCGGMSKKKQLDSILFKYAGVIRWANFSSAMNFLDPEISDENKPTRLDVERLQQFSVSAYEPAPITPGPDENSILQTVQIKLYNLHTKREKIVIDQQQWRYDDDAKTWFLVTGLPDITR